RRLLRRHLRQQWERAYPSAPPTERGNVCLGRLACTKLRQEGRNSKRLRRTCDVIDGRFGARQELSRSIERFPGKLDLIVQSRNLVAGRLDQLERPADQGAMLGIHRLRPIYSNGQCRKQR